MVYIMWLWPQLKNIFLKSKKKKNLIIHPHFSVHMSAGGVQVFSGTRHVDFIAALLKGGILSKWGCSYSDLHHSFNMNEAPWSDLGGESDRKCPHGDGQWESGYTEEDGQTFQPFTPDTPSAPNTFEDESEMQGFPLGLRKLVQHKENCMQSGEIN